MTDEDKIKAMHVKMKDIGVEAIILGDNVESSIEGILPNISVGHRGFHEPPYIAQRIDVGLEGDQVQVIPLDDKENNYYYAVVKHRRKG